MSEQQTLTNAGTGEATGTVLCKACRYIGDIETYEPAMSVYQDIRCPKCHSTSNDHNLAYQDCLLERMRATK
jgi:Zn finger protein HypA/HybF involved in hydrogenase expression